jgi:ABC-type sugar transport system ATPase subunit
VIAIDHLTVRVGDSFDVLRDLNLTVPAGRYAVLMGETGCGKTTLLETVCGLRPVRAGRIVLGATDVTEFKPADRGLGYCPQDMALFEHMTVRSNLAFALEIRGRPAGEVGRRVEELAAMLRLEPHLDRTPRTMSGGERRRTALGRAIANTPRWVLLDEPLSNLDEASRQVMAAALKQFQQSTGATILHVTHNRHEAANLADAAFVMENGVVRPVGVEELSRSGGTA